MGNFALEKFFPLHLLCVVTRVHCLSFSVLSIFICTNWTLMLQWSFLWFSDMPFEKGALLDARHLGKEENASVS